MAAGNIQGALVPCFERTSLFGIATLRPSEDHKIVMYIVSGIKCQGYAETAEVSAFGASDCGWTS